MDSGPLRFRDLFLFQIGKTGAIRRVVSSRWSLVIGAIFALTAGIARNYDQVFLLDHGERFIGPLVVPLISSLLVFVFVYRSGTRDKAAEGEKIPGFYRQYPAFLGAFLMTAPLAWIYGIPVEAMTPDLLTAAKWNVFFLALVALWRVILIARVAQVVTGVVFHRMLIAVLVPASAEAAIVAEYAGMNIVGFMGGILPPDRQFLADALEFTVNGSAIVFLITAPVHLLFVFAHEERGWKSRFTGSWSPRPNGAIAGAVFAAIAWMVWATPWQQRIVNRDVFQSQLQQDEFDRAIALIRSKKKSDYPRNRPFFIDTQSVNAEDFGEILKRLEPDDPDWMVNPLLDTATEILGITLVAYPIYDDEVFRNLVPAIARLPGGKDRLISFEDVFYTYKSNGIPIDGMPPHIALFLSDLEQAGIDLPEFSEPTLPTPPGAEGDDRGTSPAN